MKLLTLTRMILKNDVVNPLFRSRLGLLSLAFIAFTVLMLAAVALTTQPSETGISAVFHRLGIYASNAPLILGAAASVPIYLTLLAGNRNVVITEADYEIILSQPVGVEELLAAKLLAGTATTAFWLIYIIVMAKLFFPHCRPLLLVSSLLVFTACLVAEEMLASSAAILYGRQPRFKAALLAYLLLGAAHSVAIHGVSPLLAAPLLPPSYALVGSIAASVPPLYAEYGIMASLALLAATLGAFHATGRLLHPEHLAPHRAAKQARRSTQIPEGAERAVRHVILEIPLRSRGHATALALLAATPLLGLMTSNLFPELGVLMSVYILAPLIVSELSIILVSQVLVNDLLALWAYRVYLIRMDPVARYLTARYAVYYLEMLSAAALFLAAYLHRPSMLLSLAAALPASVALSYATLRIAAFLLPRRRVVREVREGFYAPEAILTMPIYFVAFAASFLVYLAPLLPAVPLLAGSLASTPLLYLLSTAELSQALYSCELKL